MTGMSSNPIEKLLSGKSKLELVDMLNRQVKLLSNSKFIASLPDKGEKIRDLDWRLREEITKREKLDVADLFVKLSLLDPRRNKTSQDFDSDDDDDSVNESRILATLANHERTTDGKKIVRTFAEKTEETLSEENTESSHQGDLSAEMDIKAKRWMIKADSHEPKQRFIPNRSRTSFDMPTVERPANRLRRVVEKKVQLPAEESAVSWQHYKFGTAQTITVEESLHLQKEQEDKLKEMMITQAVERLTGRTNITVGEYITKPSDTWRSQDQSSNESDDET